MEYKNQTITKNTEEYNRGRYSKPWIAKVIPDKTGKLQYIWGEFIGDSISGKLILNEIDEGCFFAIGQRDYMHHKNSRRYFYQIKNGEPVEIDRRDI